MALPSQIDSAAPLGSADPGDGGSELRALKQFMVDVWGITNATDITVAPFAMQTDGVTRMVTRMEEFKGEDIASSGFSVDTDGNFFDVTGTTTITSMGTVQAGTVIILQFDAVLQLTHNATSLILRYGVNYTTEAGDYLAFISLGSGNWKELFRSQRTGWHLIARSSVTSSTASVSFTSGIDSTYDLYKVEFTGIHPVTDGAHLEFHFTVSGTKQADATDYELNSVRGVSDAAGWEGNTESIGTSTVLTLSNLGGVDDTEFGAGTIYFSEPDATSNKRFWFKGAEQTSEAGATSYFLSMGGALNGTQAAVDGVFLEMSTGNIEKGEFAIYGLVK